MLGWISYREGKTQESIDQFKYVIEHYSNSDSAYNAAIALGDVLTDSGNYENAVNTLKSLLDKYIDEQFSRIINKKIALIYQKKGLCDQAIAYFKKALSSDSNDFNAELQFRIAECLEDEGRFDNAVSEYLKVGYLYPMSSYWSMRSRLRTAQIFEAQERWADAKKIYTEIALDNAQESKYAQERLEWMDKHKEELE